MSTLDSTVLTGIDEARCLAKWDSIGELAAKYGAPDVYLRTAVVESKINSLLATTDLDVCAPLRRKTDITGVLRLVDDLGPSPQSQAQNVTEQDFTYYVTLAHILFLAREFEKVEQLFNGIPIGIQPGQFRYTEVLNVKASVLLATTFELVRLPKQALAVYEKVSSSYPVSLLQDKDLPAEMTKWLEALYFNYGHLIANQDTPEDKDLVKKPLVILLENYMALFHSNPSMVTSLKSTQLIKLYINQFAGSNDPILKNQIQKTIKIYESAALRMGKSPKSTNTNDAIENYIDVLMEFWTASVSFHGEERLVYLAEDREFTKTILQTLNNALYSTFHSCSIMRNYVTVLCSLGQYAEATASFKTYESYLHHIELEREKGAETVGHVGDSLQGIVTVFAKMIQVELRSNDLQRIKLLGDTLKRYLSDGLRNHERIGANDISEGHAYIAKSYTRYSKDMDDSVEVEKYEALAIKHYIEAMEANPNDANNYFHYALALAYGQETVKSLEIVKSGLLHNQLHLPSWHLLALLLSAQDEYLIALEGLTNAIKAFTLYDKRDVSVHHFDIKSQLLQMQMTRVALKEAAYGTETALDSISDVFAWYGRLFPDTYVMEEESTVTLSRNASVRSTTSGLTRNGSVKTSNEKAESRSAKLVQPPSSEQVELLQSIWLWVASIYRRAKQFGAAEDAIKEAEVIGGANTQTHTALGYLMASDRPIHAMEEFQEALDENRDNVGAIIGMGQLILEHSHIGKEVAGTGAEKNEGPYVLFISQKDELAAHARVTSLLERQIATFPGRQSSEAWWLLSEFHTKGDNRKQARKAMWKCVALEESRGVRSYSYATVS